MGFWKYMNPLYPIIRAKRDVFASVGSVAQTIAATKERLTQKAEREQLAIEGTPSELFEKAVLDGGWTDADLAQQSKRLRYAHRIFIGSAYVFVPLNVIAAIYSPWWLSIFILLGALLYLSTMLMLSAKHAWWRWQISIKRYESFLVFAGGSDFIKRVLLP